jgi:hypothetical protein
MKTYAHFDHLPAAAQYLGSDFGDGSMDASLADAIDLAVEPVRLREPDGTYSYFDLVR